MIRGTDRHMNIKELTNKICKICSYPESLNVTAYKHDCLQIDYSDGSLNIGYSDITDLCRGISLTIVNIRDGKKDFHETHRAVIKSVGFMLDMSRGCVLSVAGVKEYIDYMAAVGLNLLMLYTEDTYEVEKYPQMGYMRGRYSDDELKEIDGYASSMGIELVGCVQTLGHLEQVGKWKEFENIFASANTLIPGKEETYEFIEECIKTISQNIKSRRIHVGLDEVFTTGNDDKKELEIFNNHVNRVYDICRKYGLRPMMWSDCYFRFSRETQIITSAGWVANYDVTDRIPAVILKSVPENMDMVYWEYEMRDTKAYSEIMKAHKVFSGETIMGTAAWGWDGQLPSADYAFTVQNAAIEAAKQNGVQTVLSTLWQDGGAPSADIFYSLPSVALCAQHRYNEDTSLNAVAKILKNCTGMELSAIMETNVYHEHDTYNYHYGERYFECPVIPNTVGTDNLKSKEFMKASNALREYNCERWNDHYHFASLLLEIVSVKSELASRLHVAYANDDRAYLDKVANEILPGLIKAYEEAYETKKKLWLKHQKAFGFDGANRLYGGCILNAKYAHERLVMYLNGEIAKIDELEEAVKNYKRASVIPDYKFI